MLKSTKVHNEQARPDFFHMALSHDARLKMADVCEESQEH